MGKQGTTMATGHAMKAASTSGVRHGPSNKSTNATGKPKSVMGKGMSSSTTKPIKGSDRGGV